MTNHTATVIIPFKTMRALKVPGFGDVLHHAICSHARILCQGGYNDVEMNAVRIATVVDVSHNDYNSVIAVGNGEGAVIGSTTKWDATKRDNQVKILQTLANSLGYDLVKQNVPANLVS